MYAELMSHPRSELMLPPQRYTAVNKDEGEGPSSSSVDTKNKGKTASKRRSLTDGPLHPAKQLKHDAQAKRLLLAQAAEEENVKLRAELAVLQSEVTSLRCLLQDAKTTLSVSIQSQQAANETMRPPDEGYVNTFNTLSIVGSTESRMDSVFNSDYNA